MKTQGTPQNIDHLIERVLLCVTARPRSQMTKDIKAVFRDYLAQSFNAFMLRAPDESEAKRFEELFKKLVGE